MSESTFIPIRIYQQRRLPDPVLPLSAYVESYQGLTAVPRLSFKEKWHAAIANWPIQPKSTSLKIYGNWHRGYPVNPWWVARTPRLRARAPLWLEIGLLVAAGELLVLGIILGVFKIPGTN